MDDISHACKQQKSLCLTLWFAKLQMRPYKTSCCAEHVEYIVTFIGYFYFMQLLCHSDSVRLLIAHYTTVIMLAASSKRGKGNDLYFQVTGDMWLTLN